MFIFLMEQSVTTKLGWITIAGNKLNMSEKIGISKSKWHLPLKQFFWSKIRLKNINDDDDVRKHQCVSNARGARSDQVPDLPVNNNAKPDGQLHISADAEAYFTFDGNGQAKSNNYHSIHDNDNDDNQWIVDK